MCIMNKLTNLEQFLKHVINPNKDMNKEKKLKNRWDKEKTKNMMAQKCQ